MKMHTVDPDISIADEADMEILGVALQDEGTKKPRVMKTI